MKKTHKLNEKDLFDLIMLQKTVVHWDTVLKTTVGFIAKENKLDPQKGKLTFDLSKGTITFEPNKKIITK